MEGRYRNLGQSTQSLGNQLIHSRAVALVKMQGKTQRLEQEAEEKISAHSNTVSILMDNRSDSSGMPPIMRPLLLTAKHIIYSFITLVRSSVSGTSDERATFVALRYIGEVAHESYLAQIRNHSDFETYEELCEGLESRFRVVNKEIVARDKLSK